jgi:hypothetical protein
MALRFLDTNDVPLPAIYRMSGSGGVPGPPSTVRFECRDGYFLYATASAGMTVEARVDGDTGWTNIVDSPIDVSPYAPDVTDFNVRLTPAVDGDYEISLFVSENP